MDTVASVDTAALVNDATATAAYTADAAVNGTVDAAAAAVDTVEEALDAAGDAAEDAYEATADTAAEAVDETANLLSDPVKSFGTISSAAADAAADGGESVVKAVDDASEAAVLVAVDIADETVEATSNVGRTGLDALGEASVIALGSMQKIMELDPVFIFRQVVKRVLLITRHVVIGAPLFLLIQGAVMWFLDLEPNAYIVIVLACLMGATGVPGWFWIRKRTRKLLNIASVEIEKMNSEECV